MSAKEANQKKIPKNVSFVYHLNKLGKQETKRALSNMENNG